MILGLVQHNISFVLTYEESVATSGIGVPLTQAITRRKRKTKSCNVVLPAKFTMIRRTRVKCKESSNNSKYYSNNNISYNFAALTKFAIFLAFSHVVGNRFTLHKKMFVCTLVTYTVTMFSFKSLHYKLFGEGKRIPKHK